MSAVKLTIHGTGSGTCKLTGKTDADGLTVSFEDGTVRESFLSWRAFRQLAGLKAGANLQNGARPASTPPQTGGQQ